MSEATTETTEVTTATTQTQGEPAELGDGGKAALVAERAARKSAEKSATDLKARLDKIEAANLSDLEKAQKEAVDAATRLVEYEKRTLRMEAALAAGLPAEDVDRLRGDTAEELLADAQSLAGRLAKTAATPLADLSQGARGNELALNGDPLEQALRSKLGI